MLKLTIRIMGLSDTKLTNNSRTDEDDATLIYMGNPSQLKSNYHEVGILVNKELRKYVTNVITLD